jgi:hypothetical protein
MEEGEETNSPWKLILSIVSIFIIILLLVGYWFIPFNQINLTEFTASTENSTQQDAVMQFYANMRFPESTISYKIIDCPTLKKDDMESAFSILAQETNLNFFPAETNQQISVTCDSKARVEKGLFIAGEGGPTNITKAGKYNVILNGKVLLYKESQCPKPNIAIHELLHAIGFAHSNNKNNIMYNFSSCSQEITQTTINKINKLYSIPTHQDLLVEKAKATLKGKYLNLNISIRNNGLKSSTPGTIKIYVDNKEIKKLAIESIKIGYGKIITLTNLWVAQFNINEIKVKIESSSPDLNNTNNQIVLKVQK